MLTSLGLSTRAAVPTALHRKADIVELWIRPARSRAASGLLDRPLDLDRRLEPVADRLVLTIGVETRLDILRITSTLECDSLECDWRPAPLMSAAAAA